MEIELERYQQKFKTEEKQLAKHEISLAQTASIIEATAFGTENGEKTTENARISNVFGARGAYIANTLSNVAIHYFLLWAAVFVAVIVLLNKGLTLLTSSPSSVTKGDERNNEKHQQLKKGGISVDFAADAKAQEESQSAELLTTPYSKM